MNLRHVLISIQDDTGKPLLSRNIKVGVTAAGKSFLAQLWDQKDSPYGYGGTEAAAILDCLRASKEV